jgi:hypothetical protein
MRLNERARAVQTRGAMAGWIHDMDGHYQNTGQNLSELPPWRVFADILMAARIYE